MAVTPIKLSSIPGQAPAISQLAPGELAINTYDGVLYFVKNTGTPALVAVGAGVASRADALAVPRAITLAGDAGGSVSFDGSANVTLPVTLPDTGVAAGTYNTVVVNAKGLVTAASYVAPGTSSAPLGYTPVNKGGDSMTGPLDLTAGSSVTGSGAPATLALVAAGAAAGQKRAAISYNGSLLQLQFLNDAGSSGAAFLSATRAGNAASNLTLTADLTTIGGALAVTGNATAPTPPGDSNDTRIATTAFVKAQAQAASSGLPYTPVQQGTGIGQGNNAVKIGWNGTKLRATVDVTDVGTFAFEGWVANATVSNVSGVVALANGGTGSASAAGARANLGIAPGTTAGTFAAGDDARITGALPRVAPSATGGATITGGLTLGGMAVFDTAIELGSVSVVRPAYIDFHSSGALNDWDSRIIASGGTAGSTNAGSLSLQAQNIYLDATTLGNDKANKLAVAGAAAGSPPTLAAVGSDASIGISYAAKGAGLHSFLGPVRSNAAVTALGITTLPNSAFTASLPNGNPGAAWGTNAGGDFVFNSSVAGSVIDAGNLAIRNVRTLGVTSPLTDANWQAQGAYLGWNGGGIVGGTSFVNSKGLGEGGFDWWNVASAQGAAPAKLASLDKGGAFSAASLTTAGNLMFGPGANCIAAKPGGGVGGFFGTNAAGDVLLGTGVAGGALNLSGMPAINAATIGFGTATGAKLNLYGTSVGVGTSASELTLFGPSLVLRSALGGAATASFDATGMNATAIGATTAASAKFTTLAVSGQATLSNALFLAGMAVLDNSIELGSQSVARPAYVDFHTSGTNNDYDARILATGGAAGTPSGADLYISARNIFLDAITVGNNKANRLAVAGAAAGAGPTLSAVGSDANVDIGYATKGTGAHRFTGGEVASSSLGSNGNGGQFRLLAGAGPSAMLRNDGTACYLLDSATASGGFSSHRPMSWNLATGNVSIATDGAATTVGGPLAVNGPLSASVRAQGGNTPVPLAEKLGERISVADFGAAGDGTNDDWAAIQSAIDTVSGQGGGELHFPAGRYLISKSLRITTSGVKLRGAGRGAFHDTNPYNPATTALVWGGASDNTGMVMFYPASSSAQKLTDVGMTGIKLVGTPGYTSGPKACYGLLLYSVQHSDFDLHTVEFITAAVALSVMPANEAANCEGITLSLRFRQINQAGTALQLGGSSTGNTCFCHFPFLYGYILNGIGLDIQDADNCTFNQVWIDSIGPDTNRPRSICFRGRSSSLGGARANTIEHFSGSVHNNIVYSEGTETAGVTLPAYSNRIVYFDNSNAPLTAQVGTGATFYWSGNNNPTGMREDNLDPNNGHVTFSNGWTQFWGTTANFGAGTTNVIKLPFSCTRILSVQAVVSGTSNSGSVIGVVGCFGFTVQPGNAASQQFSLYAPATGYYNYTGCCLR